MYFPLPKMKENLQMATLTTKDCTSIFYNDWGPKDAQPIMFHHGWPLSADDWNNQMMFFLSLGHSTGGGEVARYVARAEAGRVSKAVLIGAVPPIMVKTEQNPGGLLLEVFDRLRAALATNRLSFIVTFHQDHFMDLISPTPRSIRV
jgi:non-heme chloroperoxidase